MQICLAVEKERQSRLEELKRTELELEKVKEERDLVSSRNNAENANKENEYARFRNLINKLKKVCGNFFIFLVMEIVFRDVN